MSILVVGAGGFVGRRLVERLHAEGRAVIAGVRRSRPGFVKAGIEERVFDAADAAAVKAAMAGISHVVNCVMGDGPTMIGATRTLLDAARAAGCQRFVHFSSIAVFGNASGEIGDDAPVGQNVDAYGQAKIECEHLVEAATKAGLRCVTLRPALIYGPGAEQWSGRIARLLRWKRLGDLGAAGDGVCNLIHVEDVVNAAISALDRPEAAGKAFNLAMEKAPSWNRYLMEYGRALGATPLHRVPARNLRIETKILAIPLKIAQIVTGKLRFGGALVPDIISPSLARLFPLDARYHSPRADIILGAPRISYDEGLRSAAQWARNS